MWISNVTNNYNAIVINNLNPLALDIHNPLGIDGKSNLDLLNAQLWSITLY